VEWNDPEGEPESPEQEVKAIRGQRETTHKEFKQRIKCKGTQNQIKGERRGFFENRTTTDGLREKNAKEGKNAPPGKIIKRHAGGEKKKKENHYTVFHEAKKKRKRTKGACETYLSYKQAETKG